MKLTALQRTLLRFFPRSSSEPITRFAIVAAAWDHRISNRSGISKAFRALVKTRYVTVEYAALGGHRFRLSSLGDELFTTESPTPTPQGTETT